MATKFFKNFDAILANWILYKQNTEPKKSVTSDAAEKKGEGTGK